jgi:RNA polymerase sigma factor (sigma-70 family)
MSDDPHKRAEADLHRLVEDHLPIAEFISLEYARIPGCSIDDLRSESHIALIKAAEAFDPRRGEFSALAYRSVRNRLNTLYAKQLRLANLFPKSLDDPIQWEHDAGAASDPKEDHLADPKAVVTNEVRRLETIRALGVALKSLTPRERVVVEGLRLGKTYPEMANSLGVSKQAVHKTSRAALDKLRNALAKQGHRRVASDGHLGSAESPKAKSEG